MLKKVATPRANADIRELLRERGLRQWQVASVLGVSDAALCKALREPLNPEDKLLVLDAVDALTAAKEKEVMA